MSAHWSQKEPSFVEVPKAGTNRILPEQGNLPPSTHYSSGVAAPINAPYAAKDGSPTDYMPEFCDLVLEESAQGYTLTAIASLFGVGLDVFRKWRSFYPDFDLACTRALSQRQRFFESVLIDVCRTGGVGSQANAAIKALASMRSGDFQERQQIEHSGSMALEALVNDSLKVLPAPKTIEGEKV